MIESRVIRQSIIILFVILILTGGMHARDLYNKSEDDPGKMVMHKQSDFGDYCWGSGSHTTGKIHLYVQNDGYIGNNSLPVYDDMTGRYLVGMRYPYYSNHVYLSYAELWVGAIIGRDTLVDNGWLEFNPPACPQGEVIKRSIEKISPYYSEEAKAEQEYEMIYTDTSIYFGPGIYIDPDYVEGRPHKPIGIEVRQKSYSWSYDYADDFVIFDFTVKSLSRKPLRKAYIGILVSPYVSNLPANRYLPRDGGNDEYVGYIKSYPSNKPCPGFIDTVDMAYFIDNNAYPNADGEYTSQSPRGGCAIRLLQIPSDSLRFNYNWWVSNYADISRDWAPRKFGSYGNPFRDMNGYFGTPRGDRNRYYVMSNGEFDYDQILTDQDHTAEGYLPRPQHAYHIALGDGAEFLLSFGPYDMYIGETVHFAFAIVCGENVHREENDYRKYVNPLHPYEFYKKLDFSDLANNAKWAAWVYDNPGYDTDKDGYYGKTRDCCLDSVLIGDGVYECTKKREHYYTGDGVPDIRGAAPPPSPPIRLTGGCDNYLAGTFTLRWNGLNSETTLDPFSQEYDFEGYRIYLSLSGNKNDFAMITSFDKEDYVRWVWDKDYGEWIVKESPLTIDSLRALYGEGFDPFEYTREDPMNDLDEEGEVTSYFFRVQDWNKSDLRDTNKIHKVYPDQPYPSTLNLDSARMYYPDEVTEEGYLKYFEYKYTVRNLLRSNMYYVAVTAFDYGAPGLGLQALETDPTKNMLNAYAQNTASEVEEEGLNVIVYPNPYRADANYRRDGFEGRGQADMPDFRVRALHFINLPHQCTIRIFSIDGDLIRVIHHDYPIDDPNAAHDTWDLITRNTQEPVSGIYYYSVVSEYGNQVGKFVLIM